MVVNDLDKIRKEVDECGDQMLFIFAQKYLSQDKSWHEIQKDQQTTGDDKVKYIGRFYELISEKIQDKQCKHSLQKLQAEDKAIQRIMKGSDFEHVKELSDDIFNILEFFFDPDDPELVKILQCRFALIEQIALFKKASKVEIRKPAREAAIIETTKGKCQRLGLPKKLASVMYTNLILPVAFQIEELIINRL